ncbi:alpha/beta hydrolase [Halosimplex rubrum]|uniref:Alpha/beta hydrolase n=1 Tax=Halosimplex rubrum TaxID=869889 RepID=A0A7D5TDC4_9EURY|nr:alpha/beta hydrolase [Halosimplex rubrum]QLH78016.1 alpha/beta hydrolase [Halosimplex rubrum]
MPTVSTNDIETYYERRGERPPVVFVHGAVVDHSQWDPQLTALSDEYTTVGYDVRGHGRTGGSRRGRYSVDLFADDLDALLDALEIDRAVLCGLSTGGCIAQVYAARHPDRVAGLVLADTFAPEILSVGERIQRSLLLRATVPPVRLVGYERVEKAMVWLQEKISGEGVSGDYEQIERIRETGPKMATDEFAKVIGAVAGFHHTELRFPAISAPTLVLYGEHEAPFMRRQARHLATEIGGATLRAVPGGGHASNLDNPEFVTDAVRELLAEVYPAETTEVAETSGA